MNQKITNFLIEYDKQPTLVDSLGKLYDFVDELFLNKDEEVYDLINDLIQHFDKIDNHSSELKTMLVISKPFKDHPKIAQSRANLLQTYNDKHDKDNSKDNCR